MSPSENANGSRQAMRSDSRPVYGALVVLLLTLSCDEARAPAGTGAQPSSANPAARADSVARPAEQAAPDSSQRFGARVAVFLEASPREIERVRSETTEDDFAVMADDLMFYRATAQEYLETRGVAVVRFVGRRTLTFMVAGRPRQYDFSRESTLDVVVLYEPGRQPKAIAPADIHEAAEYFGFDDGLQAAQGSHMSESQMRGGSQTAMSGGICPYAEWWARQPSRHARGRRPGRGANRRDDDRAHGRRQMSGE